LLGDVVAGASKLDKPGWALAMRNPGCRSQTRLLKHLIHVSQVSRGYQKRSLPHIVPVTSKPSAPHLNASWKDPRARIANLVELKARKASYKALSQPDICYTMAV
jgi:hypothetical protein